MVQDTLTFNQVLTFLNTGLLGLVAFLFRDTWARIHRRLDSMESQHTSIRERVASLETGRWGHPRRRHDDNNTSEE